MRTPLLSTLLLATSLAARGIEPAALADKPEALWRSSPAKLGAPEPGQYSPNIVGDVTSADGPRPPMFAGFPPENHAMHFGPKHGSIRIADPGERSPFDFAVGESITLEAWVSPEGLKEGQQMYVIGKGRTQNKGVPQHNQNWALRIRGLEGTARVGFLFRDAIGSGEEAWHRWTSDAGFAVGDGWHHIAVTYTFGKGGSIRGFIDGKESAGVWDFGGQTDLAPVVDNDEVWIGSSMGGAASASFEGDIDEIAIHRGTLSPERIASRFQMKGERPKGAAKKITSAPPMPPPQISADELPKGLVRVEVLEHPDPSDPNVVETGGGNDSGGAKDKSGQDASWSQLPPVKTDEFNEPAFGFAAITNRYDERGIKTDRSRPFMVRGSAVVTIPAGENKILLRSLGGSRLAIDGKQVALLSTTLLKYADNEFVPDQAVTQLVKELPLLPPGHREVLATFQGDGKPHVVSLEVFVGGKAVRPELGTALAWISQDGKTWQLLTPGTPVKLATTDDVESYVAQQSARAEERNAERRRIPAEESYWRERHELARKNAKPAPEVPKVGAKFAGANAIDAFIGAKLEKNNATPAPLADDASFLRRVTLDTTGLQPTPEQITAFLADKSPDKRARAIDRLLDDKGWADRWTPYWQDVLAENPNMLKGTLNNTGPFRWWIHEALSDNKSIDRFVTELVGMRGSTNYGGPAGFSVATQNDLPLAAKAQVVSSAFLGMEMKCARCHDAPNHPFDQADLFKLAAMLGRAPMKVPDTSLTRGLSVNSHVTVSLKAGETIEPHWPFTDIASEPLPGVIRTPGDTRELLAAAITDPRNERFAQVMANRLWREFIGFGIIDPVDDWESSAPSHKELLQWLGHELITHDYDLKHLARVILNSHTYQRVVTPEGSRVTKSGGRLFQSPARRRLTAEEVVDVLHAAAGKKIDCELLTMDPEGRQNGNDQGNLGQPTRAWQFAALSNERDRPALAKPRAQVIADVLATFGWRESRPEPRSTRDQDANILQPALLANGTFGARIARLSDDSAFTADALKKQPLDALIRGTFLRILARPPEADELATFTKLLAPGYEQRLTGAAPAPKAPPITKAVSWANHLNPEATTVVLEIEKRTKAGLPPTPQLTADWRERMEDMVWALMVSPEFTCIP